MTGDGRRDETGGDHGPGDRAELARGLSIEPFVFTGSRREYFRIWIAGFLLTIVTLGVYSAWARARRLRYFYRNTRLAGHSFDYHATPMQILGGRIQVVVVVAAVVFAAYSFIFTVFRSELSLLAFLVVFIVPHFVARGARFNARMTSYRNVRFDFSGGYWGAFKAYVIGGAITWFSIGLLAPVASRWMWRYTFNNLTYGGRPFATDPKLRPLYRQWLIPAGVAFGGFAVIGISAFGLSAFFTNLMQDLMAVNDADRLLGAVFNLTFRAFLPILILMTLATLGYSAGVRNVVFNATVHSGGNKLHSAIGRRRFMFISVTNIFATVLTLGLARPWAAIRMAKFLAAGTAVEFGEQLDRRAEDGSLQRD